MKKFVSSRITISDVGTWAINCIGAKIESVNNVLFITNFNWFPYNLRLSKSVCFKIILNDYFTGYYVEKGKELRIQ